MQVSESQVEVAEISGHYELTQQNQSSLPRRELHCGWSLRVETIPIRLETTQTSIYRYWLNEVGFIHIMENYTAIHGVRNSSIHYYQIFRIQNYTNGQERENIYSLLIFIYKSWRQIQIYLCFLAFFFNESINHTVNYTVIYMGNSIGWVRGNNLIFMTRPYFLDFILET